MTTPPNNSTHDELQRYAFHVEPQVHQDGDTWTAAYPSAPWSVTAPTRAAALERLGQDYIRRLDAGEDAHAYGDEVFRRHLRHPVPGVYAVDNDLYRSLIHEPHEELQRAVEEAERRRQLGRPYTLFDHQRSRTDRG